MAKTIFEHRLIAALVLCLSGLALLPFNPLPSRVFGWELLAGSYERIFQDGFEEGTPKAWNYSSPENMRLFPTSQQSLFNQTYRIDSEQVSQFGDTGVVMLSGFTSAGEPVFAIEARVTETGLEVRAGAILDGGSWQRTDWQLIERDALLGIEWQRGHPLAEDGLLYVSVGSELRFWLTDLDNDKLDLAATGVTQLGTRTLLIPQNSAF